MNNAEQSHRTTIEREEQQCWMSISNLFSRHVSRVTQTHRRRAQRAAGDRSRAIEAAEREFLDARSRVIASEVEAVGAHERATLRAKVTLRTIELHAARVRIKHRKAEEERMLEERVDALMHSRTQRLEKIQRKQTEQLVAQMAVEVALLPAGVASKLTSPNQKRPIAVHSPDQHQPAGPSHLTPLTSSSRQRSHSPPCNTISPVAAQLAASSEVAQSIPPTTLLRSESVPPRFARGGASRVHPLSLTPLGTKTSIQLKFSSDVYTHYDSSSADEFKLKRSTDRQLSEFKHKINIVAHRSRKAAEHEAGRQKDAEMHRQQEQKHMQHLMKRTREEKEHAIAVERMLNPTRRARSLPLNVVADRGRSIGESLSRLQQLRREEAEKLVLFFESRCRELEEERERLMGELYLGPLSLVEGGAAGPMSGFQHNTRRVFPASSEKRSMPAKAGSLVLKTLQQLSSPSPAVEHMTAFLRESSNRAPKGKRKDESCQTDRHISQTLGVGSTLDFSAIPLEERDMYFLSEVVSHAGHLHTIDLSSHAFDERQSEILLSTLARNMHVTKLVIEGCRFEPPSVGEALCEVARRNREHALHKKALQVAREKVHALDSVERSEAAALPEVRKAAHVAYEFSVQHIVFAERHLRESIQDMAFLGTWKYLTIAEAQDRERLEVVESCRDRLKKERLTMMEGEEMQREVLVALELTTRSGLKEMGIKEKRRIVVQARAVRKQREAERDALEDLERRIRTDFRKAEFDGRKKLASCIRLEREVIDTILQARARAAAEEAERLRKKEAATKMEEEKRRVEQEKARKRLEAVANRHVLERENVERAESAQRERAVGAEERRAYSVILDCYKHLRSQLKRWQAFVVRLKQRRVKGSEPLKIVTHNIATRRTHALATMVPTPLLDEETQFEQMVPLPSYMQDRSLHACDLEADEISPEEWKRQKGTLLGATIEATIADALPSDEVRHFDVFHSVDHARDVIVDVTSGLPIGHLVHAHTHGSLRIEVIRNDSLGWAHLWALVKSVGFKRKWTPSSNDVATDKEVSVLLRVTIRSVIPSEKDWQDVANQPPIVDVRRQPWCLDSSTAAGTTKGSTLVPDEKELEAHFRPISEFVTTVLETKISMAFTKPFLVVPAPSGPGDSRISPAATSSITNSEDMLPSIEYNVGQGDAVLIPYVAPVALPEGVRSCEGAVIVINQGPCIDSDDYIWPSLRSSVCISPSQPIVFLGTMNNKVATIAPSRDGGLGALGVRSTFEKRPRGAPTAIHFVMCPDTTPAMLQALLTSLAFRNDSEQPPSMEPRRVVVSVRFPTVGVTSSLIVPVQFVKVDIPTSIVFKEPVPFRLPPPVGSDVAKLIEQPLCYLASDCVVEDPDTTDFLGGYLSLRVLDERATDFLAIIPHPSVAERLRCIGTDIVFDARRVACVAQKSSSWIFIDFEHASIEAVSALLRSLAYSSTEAYTVIFQTVHKNVEVALAVASAAPVRVLCPFRVSPPLFTVGSSALKIVYMQGSGQQRLSHYDIVSEDREWQLGRGGFISIELASGFCDEDVVSLLEDEVLSVNEPSDAQTVVSVASRSTAASSMLSRSHASASAASLHRSNSRKISFASEDKKDSSTRNEASGDAGHQEPVASLRLNGAEIGTMAQSPRRLLIRFGETVASRATAAAEATETQRKRKLSKKTSQSAMQKLNASALMSASKKLGSTSTDNAGAPAAVVTRKEIALIMKRLMFESVSSAPKQLHKVVRITMNNGQQHSSVGAVEIDMRATATGIVLQRLDNAVKVFRSRSRADLNGFRLFDEVEILDQQNTCYNGAFISVDLIGGGGDASGDQLGMLTPAQQAGAVRSTASLQRTRSQFFQHSRNEAQRVTPSDHLSSDTCRHDNSGDSQPDSADGASRRESEWPVIDDNYIDTTPLHVAHDNSLMMGPWNLGIVFFDVPNAEGHSNMRVTFCALPSSDVGIPMEWRELQDMQDKLRETGICCVTARIARKVLSCITFTSSGAKVKPSVRIYQVQLGFDQRPALVGKLRVTVTVVAPMLWNPDFATDATFKSEDEIVAVSPKLRVCLEDNDSLASGTLQLTIATGEQPGDALDINWKKLPDFSAQQDFVLLSNAAKKDTGDQAAIAKWTGGGPPSSSLVLQLPWNSCMTPRQLEQILRAVVFRSSPESGKALVGGQRVVRAMLSLRGSPDDEVCWVDICVSVVTCARPMTLLVRKNVVSVIRGAPRPLAVFEVCDLRDDGHHGGIVPPGAYAEVRVSGACASDVLDFRDISDLDASKEAGLRIASKGSGALVVSTTSSEAPCSVLDFLSALRRIGFKCAVDVGDRVKRKQVNLLFFTGSGAHPMSTRVLVDVLPPLFDLPSVGLPMLRGMTSATPPPASAAASTMNKDAFQVADVVPSVIVPNVHFIDGGAEVELSLVNDTEEQAELLSLEFLGNKGGMQMNPKTGELSIDTRRVGKLETPPAGAPAMRLLIHKERQKSIAPVVQRALRCAAIRYPAMTTDVPKSTLVAVKVTDQAKNVSRTCEVSVLLKPSKC